MFLRQIIESLHVETAISEFFEFNNEKNLV